ncbi:MAG: hypothetical protein RRA92_03415 [Gemmatimonadota bacterium]|nr:hypothetical protein [Gemmatimonadota bacterium]
MRPACFALVLLLGLAADAAAQGACAGGSDRPRVRVLTDPIEFRPPGVADFRSGFVFSDPVRVRVTARGGPSRPWDLCLAGVSPDFGGGKPLADLQWQVEGDAGWTSVDTADRLVTSGGGNTQVVLRFRSLLRFETDAPGAYEARLRFAVAGR